MSNNRRVLVFGADGLRPDLITPDIMPTVCALAAQGVRFTDHHAVYPTHTRVNISALATGSMPGRHGIVANTMLVPFATEDHIIDTANYQHLDALDVASNGQTHFVPSLGHLLTERGERVAVTGNGSAGSNMLWTRNDRGRIVNTGTAYGIADLYDLREKLGEIPDAGTPNTARSRYITRAVTDLYLDDPRNRVIVIWHNEPDTSLHRHGLGSPQMIDGLRGVDASLKTILDALDANGQRDDFDVIVVSDHGHSTVQSHNTLREYLHQAAKDLNGSLPQLATASDYIYAAPGTDEPDTAALQPLVEWLMAQSWVDIVLGGTDDLASLPGVMPLASVWGGQTNSRRPLLAVSPRWSAEVNEFGVPGSVATLTTQSALRSSHGSLAPYDLHATLIANGPSFQSGLVSSLPTGAIDLLPTLATILDLPIPATVDGRVLREGLVNAVGAPDEVTNVEIEPEHAAHGFTPRVRLHQVGATTYVHGSLSSEFIPTQQPQAALVAADD